MLTQQLSNEPRQYSEYSNNSHNEIDVEKYWLVLKRQWRPAALVFGAVVLLSALAALLGEPVYQAEGKVQFSSNRTPSLTGLEEELGEVEVLTFMGDPLETQSEIVRSIPVAKETIERLNLRDTDGEYLDPRDFLQDLRVLTVPGTEVLHITFSSSDPDEAAAVVNQVIDAYRNQNVINNREVAAAARRFIEEQLPATEAEVSAVESALRRFKEQNKVLSLEEETVNAVTALATTEEEMNEVRTELADLNARTAALLSQLGVSEQQALALGYLNQSEGVQTTLTALQDAQTQLTVERSRYRDSHPTIEELERRVSNLESLLQERIYQVLGQRLEIPISSLQLGELRQERISELAGIQVEKAGLMDRMGELRQTEAIYRQRAEILPQLEKDQREITRRLDAAQATYQTLLTQLQEIRVLENQAVGNVRVVSLAEIPELPMGPNRKLYLAAGICLGAILAIATAFLLDLFDNSVKTVKEAKELFGYNLLGAIPLIQEAPKSLTLLDEDPSNPRFLVNQPDYWGLREAYQMLQANLKFLQVDTELKTLVVTSSVPGEGRSDVAANLAMTMAQTGRRVLLVDADMRYPHQQRTMDAMPNLGLSDVLAGYTEVDTAIQRVTDCFHLLVVGSIPPNPLVLLDSIHMKSLLTSVSEDYDLVIIDTPPLMGYADASILGKMADGLLLVVRPGIVNSAQARITKEILEQFQQRVLGMVVNGVNPDRDPNSHYYYTTKHRALYPADEIQLDEAVLSR